MTGSKNIPSDQKIHVAEEITCFRQFQFIECIYFDDFEFLFIKFLKKFSKFCFIYNDFNYIL